MGEGFWWMLTFLILSFWNVWLTLCHQAIPFLSPYPAGFFSDISKGGKQSLVCQFREDSVTPGNGESLSRSNGPIWELLCVLVAAAVKNHTDFEASKRKIDRNSSRILLIFLTCRKINSKNVNLQCNQLSEGNQLRIIFEYQEMRFNNIRNYPWSIFIFHTDIIWENTCKI